MGMRISRSQWGSCVRSGRINIFWANVRSMNKIGYNDTRFYTVHDKGLINILSCPSNSFAFDGMRRRVEDFMSVHTPGSHDEPFCRYLSRAGNSDDTSNGSSTPVLSATSEQNIYIPSNLARWLRCSRRYGKRLSLALRRRSCP